MLIESDWDKWSDSQKNDHLFLGFMRDACVSELLPELGWHVNDEQAEEWIERFVTFQYPWSAFDQMKQCFISHEYYVSLSTLNLLRKIVMRIARLEREICKIPIYDNELRAA